MKRKVFGASVLGTRHQRSGNYCLIKKNGMILFSRDLSAAVKGQHITFVQDEDRPKDWYLEVSKKKDVDGIPVREFAKLERCGIQSSLIAKELLQSLSLEENGSYELTVSSDPSTEEGGAKSFAILTGTAKPSFSGRKKENK